MEEGKAESPPALAKTGAVVALRTAPVFGFDLSIRITSGAMTFCMTGGGMGEH